MIISLEENGTIKAKVEKDKFCTELLTTRNGLHWTGIPLTPLLAEMTIKVLQDYLKELEK